MKTDMSISPVDTVRRTSYGVLFAGLAVGIAALPFDLRVALFPAVFVFGWSQIGGL